MAYMMAYEMAYEICQLRKRACLQEKMCVCNAIHVSWMINLCQQKCKVLTGNLLQHTTLFHAEFELCDMMHNVFNNAACLNYQGSVLLP